jgi:hypothetical protein
MWENSAALIGIPAAIKATIEVIEKLHGALSGTDAQQVKTNLVSVNSALEKFAEEATELAAFKDLHALTNQFSIDLRLTFQLAGPDPTQVLGLWSQSLVSIRAELKDVKDGARGGGQLAALMHEPTLMRYFKRMPPDVAEKVPAGTWDQHFWGLLGSAREETENFSNLCKLAVELRDLNSALNNYADRSLKKGISQFDDIIKQLRTELAKPGRR